MCATGMVAVMDGPETGPFNIGNPIEFTMLELAQMVQEVVNPEVKIVYKENTADDPSRRKPDITKVASVKSMISCPQDLIARLCACLPSTKCLICMLAPCRLSSRYCNLMMSFP